MAIRSISESIHHLEILKDGWFDGSGLAPKPEILSLVEMWLNSYFTNSSYPFPYLYPTAEGGVTAEWSLGVFDLFCVEFDPVRQIIEWHGILGSESDYTEHSIYLWDVEGFQSLTEEILSLLKKKSA